MIYWSTHNIAAIEVGSTSLDTIVRLQSKQYSNVTSYAVSATSYALLCNLDQKTNETFVNEIQKFLQEQHMSVGGFASTQVSLEILVIVKLF